MLAIVFTMFLMAKVQMHEKLQQQQQQHIESFRKSKKNQQ